MNWIAQASGLTPSALAFAAAMTFGAAAIRGLTGFGMAIILVPLLGLVIRPDQAVVLGILLQFVIGPVGIGTILADAHRQSALLIVICAMAATPFGLFLLAHTAPDVARVAIAAIAIGAFLLVVLPGAGRGKPRDGRNRACLGHFDRIRRDEVAHVQHVLHGARKTLEVGPRRGMEREARRRHRYPCHYDPVHHRS